MTDDEYRLPDGWKSWPAPIKRELKRLLMAVRDSRQSCDDGQVLVTLTRLEQSEALAREIAILAKEHDQPEIAVRSAELLAVIERWRDALLGLTEL
jgi:hypothetical protein